MNKYSPYPGDVIDAKLEPGEYVLNRNAVKAIGEEKLNKINNQQAPRFPKGYNEGGQVDQTPGGFENLPQYADNGLIFKARRAVHNAKMAYHSRKDPQLKAYLKDNDVNWQGAIAEGQSASKFLEDNGGSSDNFDSTQSTRFTRGSLKGATLSDSFREDVTDGDYANSKVNNDFLLKTKKHPAGYDLEQYKMFGKIKRQSGGLMSKVHTGLDGLGMLPGVGVPADIINAALYGGEALMAGDPLERNEALSLMGLSGAAAIPLIGQAATAGKYAHKANKVVKAVKASKATPGNRALYRKALQKQDAIANPKFNKYNRDAHIGGNNPYRYDKPKFADPSKRQIAGRDGVDKISGLPIEGHRAGFQKGGTIPQELQMKALALKQRYSFEPYSKDGKPAEMPENAQKEYDSLMRQSRNMTMPASTSNIFNVKKTKSSKPNDSSELKHMAKANAMLRFDEHKDAMGIPSHIAERIQLPENGNIAEFSSEDFNEYISGYSDFHQLNDSQGNEPWSKEYGKMSGIGMDSERDIGMDFDPEQGPITPAEQLVLQLKSNKWMTNIDQNSPAVKKVLKDNPELGLEVANRMSDMRGKNAKRGAKSSKEIALEYSPNALHNADNDGIGGSIEDYKERQADRELLAEQSRDIEMMNPGGSPTVHPDMKLHQPEPKGPLDITNLKLGKVKQKGEKWANFKKKFGSFSDATKAGKANLKARKAIKESGEGMTEFEQWYNNKQNPPVKKQTGGYMRPDGKQGYFIGGLAALGLTGASYLKGKTGTAGSAGNTAGESDTYMGKAGNAATTTYGGFKDLLGIAKKGFDTAGGKQLPGGGKDGMPKNVGQGIGDLLQYASMAQGFSGPKSEEMALEDIDETESVETESVPTEKKTSQEQSPSQEELDAANKEVSKLSPGETPPPSTSLQVEAPITAILNPDGSTNQAASEGLDPTQNMSPEMQARIAQYKNDEWAPDDTIPQEYHNQFQRGGPVSLEGFIQQSWRNMR